MMKILGIDPGTARVGWAVISAEGTKNTSVAYGCITTPPDDLPEERLLIIHKELLSIIKRYQPDAISVEELFFATNAKTVIPVGQSRGVILLTAALSGIPVVSYTPLAVKRTICGDGKADKTQVLKMIMRLLHLTEVPKPDDAADAVAIGLTHAYSYKMKQLIK